MIEGNRISPAELGIAPKLNSEFRTLLGSKTEYGQAYSKKDLVQSIVTFLFDHGGTMDNSFRMELNHPDSTVRAFSGESEVFAGNISVLIPNSEFRRTKTNKDSADDFEEKQITLIANGIQDRINEIDAELQENLSPLAIERLNLEKNQIIKLLQ